MLTSCSNEENKFNRKQWQEITSRDQGDLPKSREPLYRVKVSNHLQTIPPPTDKSIADSRLPLCEYILKEGLDEIHITIHNFPNTPIPPRVQIERWIRQFSVIEENSMEIAPVSQNGFVGYFFSVTGILKEKRTTILGWALSLAPVHLQTLSSLSPENQKSADITIKVVGSPELVAKYQEEIINFAESFELINEIPMPHF